MQGTLSGAEIGPILIKALGSNGFPFSSSVGSMLKVCKTEAIVKNKDQLLRCHPAQIRRPKPNAIVSGLRTSGSSFPSLMNRSGLN